MEFLVIIIVLFVVAMVMASQNNTVGYSSNGKPIEKVRYPRATPYYREKFLRDERLEKEFEYYDGTLIDIIYDINESALMRMSKDCKYAVEYYTDDTVFRREYEGRSYSEEELRQKFDKIKPRAKFFEYCANLCDERLEEIRNSNEEVS